MKLIEVNSAERIKEFHKLPKEIYKNDPHWIPYIKQEIEVDNSSQLTIRLVEDIKTLDEVIGGHNDRNI